MWIAELDIYGVYVPMFMVLMLVAYLLNRALRIALERFGFYTLVWHRALFDLSMYVALLGALFFAFQEITG